MAETQSCEDPVSPVRTLEGLDTLGTSCDKLKMAAGRRRKVLVSTGSVADAAAPASDTTQELSGGM